MLNLLGYRMWYYFELKSSAQKMESKLDKKEYQDSDLVTIRIPLTLPYQTDTDGFERISGEVSFEGKIYTYVQRKMENGYFVLMCLPDHGKMQLEREKNDLVKSNLDQSKNNSNKPGSGNTILKYVSSEYEENISSVKTDPLFTCSNEYASYADVTFFSLKIAAPGQPPDILS